MLASALFAIENSDVPATAAADLQAGIIYGFTGGDKDVRAMMNECFAPDQQLADDFTQFFAAIKSGDLDSVKSIVIADEERALKDADLCLNDPKYQEVHDAYYYQQDLIKAAYKDDNWQLHAMKGIRGHMQEIKDAAAAGSAAWEAGLAGDADGFYEAGTYVGAIDHIVFTYWIEKMQQTAFLQ